MGEKFNEVNTLLSQKRKGFDQVKGKTVHAVEIDDEELLIVWTDGTYSLLESEVCTECESGCGAMDECGLSVPQAFRHLEELKPVIAADVVIEAQKEFERERSEQYKQQRLAQLEQLKKELGL